MRIRRGDPAEKNEWRLFVQMCPVGFSIHRNKFNLCAENSLPFVLNPFHERLVNIFCVVVDFKPPRFVFPNLSRSTRIISTCTHLIRCSETRRQNAPSRSLTTL